jgi:hypothetical protein
MVLGSSIDLILAEAKHLSPILLNVEFPSNIMASI